MLNASRAALIILIVEIALLAVSAVRAEEINLKLLESSEIERNAVLQSYIKKNNLDCDVVVRSVLSPGSDFPFWTALCKNQKSYVVRLWDPEKDAEVRTCEELQKQTNGVRSMPRKLGDPLPNRDLCWTKF
jgi:hypothetical protein